MKILWIIKRLDGSTLKIETEEKIEPITGDGKILQGVPVAIGSKITTPNLADQGKHDVVIAATEQKL